MKLALAAVLAVLVFPAVAHGGVTMVEREVPLHGARALEATTPRFDMVGLHWLGSGSVGFRTRSLAGRWSSWQDAGGDNVEPHPWHLGEADWTGPSDAIQYRISGRVTRLRAYLLWSPVEHVPLRRLSLAGSPAIIPRLSWGADESIRRAPPVYAPSVQFAIVHHTAGTNSYTPDQAAAIVHGIEVYHVQGNGWNDIGYNFLVDRYGQLYEGRYGGVDKNVVGAHSEGFNSGSVGVAVIGDFQSATLPAAARTALVQVLAWRLDLAHVDPLSTLNFISGGNSRFPTGVPVFLRAISGHRDTYFTDCPGDALYAQLPSITQAVAQTGLPKLYAPEVRGSLGGAVRFTARLSSASPWTVTVTDPLGKTVASGSGTGTAVDWTWDATLAPPQRYTWTIASDPSVRPASGQIGPTGTAKVSALAASPATVGQDDTTTISYTLSAPAQVTATLVNAAGVGVTTLFTQDVPAGKQSFTFTPTNVPDGPYTILLTVTGPDGRQVSASVPLDVDRTVGKIELSPPVFSPNGDGRLDTLSLTLTLANPVTVTFEVRTPDGTVLAQPFSGPLAVGPQTLSFSGPLPDGRYLAALTFAEPTGPVTHTLPFASDTTPPRLQAISFLQTRFRLSEPATLRIAINGKRIVKSEPAGVFHVPWPGRVRTIRAVAIDAAGNVSAQLSYP